MRVKHSFVIIISLLLLFLPALYTLAGSVADTSANVVLAQDDTNSEATIEFSGEIITITDTTIVVNGLTVQIEQALIQGVLEVGTTVRVEGILQPNAVVIAHVVEQTNAPEIVQIIGEVTFIEGDISIINGTTVILAGIQRDFVIEPGLIVRVTGTPQPDGSFIAISIEITVLPEVTPEMTPEATPEMTPEATDEPGDVINNDGVIIVINGPVEAININIITIYGINIVIEENDPLLTVINIGDRIHVEGVIADDFDFDFDDDDQGGNITIVIIAINITFIDIDVYINEDDGQVWRDPGNCQNGPPPWAPANGWRRRCENPGGRGNGGSSRGGSGS